MKKFICLFLCVLCVNFSAGCAKNNAVLSEYDIALTLNNDMTVDGQMTLNYVNDTNYKLENLEFMLYPNAFSKGAEIKPIYLEYFDQAYESGLSYGGIEINEVKVDNKAANFTVKNGKSSVLSVSLFSELKSGQSVQIFIDFSLTLPCVNHRFGYGKNTVNLTGFYPILCPYENGKYYESIYYPSGDPFYSNVANYKVSLTVPSEYIIASSMSATFVETLQNFTTYSYKRDSVREVAFILSKNFNVVKSCENGTQITYYYFNDNLAESSLSTAKQALLYFSKKYGKYPYDEYVFCEADFIYGGMEYPCLTMIDKSLSGFDRAYTIVHETAHQWWYGLVGVNQNENAFIDEGLTEYSTVLFFDNHSEYGKGKKELLSYAYNAYVEMRKSLVKEQNPLPKMNVNLGEFTSDIDYVSIAYYRAQLMLYDLSSFMGEVRFNKFLKNLCSEYSYKNLTLTNFLHCAEKYKRGAKKFLLGYINGTTPLKYAC